ncbi:multidrug efflux SMR transporter [Bdellovibrio sp. NC01]|uniref:DMT family transporter n=1 Tax=Bdellovibrio sp. NC01 TaxID=2220073 RepID=UPI00115BF1F3|nr:multidrug efflux SMR transporter [Bdellovibrio sp. NC01]QDK38160.1 QacE family quaternary ammonium compound efflux SMR transporter [Bdellovibrio sp. NC01]
MIYVKLALAIIFEVIATSLLKKTEGFTHIPFTVTMLAGYLLSFYFLSQVVKVLPVGIVYATWSGLGIVLISTAGYFLYKQALDLPAVLGMGFIIVGVVLMNVFSKMSVH